MGEKGQVRYRGIKHNWANMATRTARKTRGSSTSDLSPFLPTRRFYVSMSPFLPGSGGASAYHEPRPPHFPNADVLTSSAKGQTLLADLEHQLAAASRLPEFSGVGGRGLIEGDHGSNKQLEVTRLDRLPDFD